MYNVIQTMISAIPLWAHRKIIQCWLLAHINLPSRFLTAHEVRGKF